MSNLKSIVKRLQDQNPGFGIGTVFDVGANKGQSTQLFQKIFPLAHVHSFEPVPQTFDILKSNVSLNSKLHLNNAGLGRSSGVVKFTSNLDTGNHRLGNEQDNSANSVEVLIKTGDVYCEENSVVNIDYLKIDTEGYDLDVLAGFTRMLADGNIANIQVECSSNLDNRFHVHLERFIHFLHPFNYRLSDIINPVRRVNKTRQPMNGIWYCDAVFALEIENPRLRRDGKN
ncbi:MAG: FkbM family methyltransferase [Halioglobus sp.]